MNTSPLDISRPRFRRGTAYLLVLGVSLMVTVTGLSALMIARITTRAVHQRTSMREAELLAMSAVEQALSVVHTDAGWRDGHLHGIPTPEQALGNGFVRYALFDTGIDEDLASGTDDPVRIYGYGRVDDVVRVHSVLVMSASSAANVLGTAVHAGVGVEVSKALQVSGGPLSTNGPLAVWGTVEGDVEAASISGWGTITGTQTAPAPPKIMPPAGIYDYYLQQAVEIPFASLTDVLGARLLGGGVLDTTSNPWGSISLNGVYHVAVPDGGTLLIDTLLLRGTLLITAGANANIDERGDVHAEPARSDYPVLMIRGTVFNLSLEGTTALLTIDPGFATGFRGLVHVIGGQSITEIAKEFTLSGTLLAEGTVTRQTGASFASITADPNLAANPPLGYAPANSGLIVVPGSWRWETLP